MTRSIASTAQPVQSITNDPVLLDVRQVAAILGCSPRHAYRLADAGRMPRPLKLGALVRWRRDELNAWISDGCPSTQAGRAGK